MNRSVSLRGKKGRYHGTLDDRGHLKVQGPSHDHFHGDVGPGGEILLRGAKGCYRGTLEGESAKLRGPGGDCLRGTIRLGEEQKIPEMPNPEKTVSARLNAGLIDLNRVDEINLAAHGGPDGDVSVLLSRWHRVHAPLHSFEMRDNDVLLRLEVKEQAGLQWFDGGKYHVLAQEDRDIRLMFLIHDHGRIDVIAVTRLGEFLDWLLQNQASDGKNAEVMKIRAYIKKMFPSLPFRSRAHVAKILREAPELFDILYQRVK